MCLQITENELCHRFLSRESMRITNNHTNCFENIFWELKIGILPEFTDKKLKDYAANLFRGEINT